MMPGLLVEATSDQLAAALAWMFQTSPGRGLEPIELESRSGRLIATQGDMRVAFEADGYAVPSTGYVSAGSDTEPLVVVVFRVTAASLRDAEKLIDVWLRPGEDDDRLISYEVVGVTRGDEPC